MKKVFVLLVAATMLTACNNSLLNKIPDLVNLVNGGDSGDAEDEGGEGTTSDSGKQVIENAGKRAIDMVGSDKSTTTKALTDAGFIKTEFQFPSNLMPATAAERRAPEMTADGGNITVERYVINLPRKYRNLTSVSGLDYVLFVNDVVKSGKICAYVEVRYRDNYVVSLIGALLTGSTVNSRQLYCNCSKNIYTTLPAGFETEAYQGRLEWYQEENDYEEGSQYNSDAKRKIKYYSTYADYEAAIKSSEAQDAVFFSEDCHFTSESKDAKYYIDIAIPDDNLAATMRDGKLDPFIVGVFSFAEEDK